MDDNLDEAISLMPYKKEWAHHFPEERSEAEGPYFGMALAPRMFSKCVFPSESERDVHTQRSHSENVLNSHKHALLLNLESLGLCVNAQKSVENGPCLRCGHTQVLERTGTVAES